jgi:uncharacterized protein (TIGR00645 family)
MTPGGSATNTESDPPSYSHSRAARTLEGILFSSRWVMAPFYVGLAASLLLLLAKFAQKAFTITMETFTTGDNDIIVGVLSLIDLSLVGNLLIMVIFAGYENFVSRFAQIERRDKPDWMGHVGFGDLKLRLMGSIIAISAIQLLEAFMNVEHMPDREMAWLVGVHLSFVTSGLLLAFMDWVSKKVRTA